MGKKRLRDMTWDDYGISRDRYKELKAFCLQYDEKKEKIRYGLSSSKSGGTPGGNYPGSPTEAQAISNAMNERDCRMIEEAARKAGPDIWEQLLKSVTQNLSYEFIEYDGEHGRIAVCRTDFYGHRRLFYSILNKMKNGYKWTG